MQNGYKNMKNSQKCVTKPELKTHNNKKTNMKWLEKIQIYLNETNHLHKEIQRDTYEPQNGTKQADSKLLKLGCK